MKMSDSDAATRVDRAYVRGVTAPRLLQYARDMRRTPTQAEHILWQRLRGRRLGGYKFRRQVGLGPYIVDFLCVECSLIVEIDGGQHASSIAYDAERTRWLDSRGYRVVRYWSNEVIAATDAVLESLLVSLTRKG